MLLLVWLEASNMEGGVGIVHHVPTPRKKRATKKPARFFTIPSNVATIPQAIVSVGSHSLGDVRFKMMLHGILTRVS